MKSEANGVPWLNSYDAAKHLGFTEPDGTVNTGAFLKWLARRPKHRPRRHKLGRMLRFRQVDLDACIETLPETTKALRLVGAR